MRRGTDTWANLVLERPERARGRRPAAIAFLGALLALAVVSVAPAAAASRKDDAAKVRRAADQVVDAGVPGVVAFVRDGRKTLKVAAGRGRIKPRQAMRVAARFRIASLTKTYVAAVVAQLAAEGKLTFEDPVERWVPGVVPNGQNITLRQLLSHRSGLFDYPEDPKLLAPYLSGDFAHRWTPEQLIALANAHPPLFAPGARTSYSNTNYIVLGLVIAAVTGRPVQTELDERIFKPLKLDSTFYAIEQRIPGRHARGYFVPEPGTRQDTTAISPTHAGAGGSIVSTAPDVARFYRALFSGRLVRADLVRDMQTMTDGYGLGVHPTPSPCGLRYGHDGAIPGYISVAVNTRDGQRQLVLLANSHTPDDKVGDRRAQRAFRRLFNLAACVRL